MRYYCYNEPLMQTDARGVCTVVGNTVVTVSEEDIRRDYYPTWYAQMCDKFGQSQVDAHWQFEDFLDEWVVVHWAWDAQTP